MKETIQSESSQIGIDESIVEFEVHDHGILRIAGYQDARIRAECYDDIAESWKDSPSELIYAMENCAPLAWEVYSIYSGFRDDLVTQIQDEENKKSQNNNLINILKGRLEAMPDEPEGSAQDWLLNVDDSYFKEIIIERIEEWFSETPDWNFEDDYLPKMATGEGAAFTYFQEEMDMESVDKLGVKVIEGAFPGNDSCFAKLQRDIEEANSAAVAAGIPVRFVRYEGDDDL